VTQTSLSTVLLIGAGLLSCSLMTAQSTRLGYGADRLLILTLRNRSTEPLIAGMIPAWRAARVDPADALRSD
jgi:hypothetical protein